MDAHSRRSPRPNPAVPRNPEEISTLEFHRRLFAGSEQPRPPASRVQGPPCNPDNPEGISTEGFFRQLFAKDSGPAWSEPARPAPQRPFNPANPEEISTEEFYRRLFADKQGTAHPEAPAPTAPTPAPQDDQEISTEEFYRRLFAEPQKPLVLGPRPGLELPALPEKFRRVRGGNRLVSYELLVGEDGRIAAKHENVAGRETYFIYEYDDNGHLLQVWRNGHLAEEYAYDGRGARIAAWNPKQGQWRYDYDQAGRLTAAGPWGFAYGVDGALREAWTPQSSYFFSAGPAAGLSRVVLPRGRVLRSVTVSPGLPVEKYVDARLVESLSWRSPLQLATYCDHERDLRMQFHYAQGRLPQAVTVQSGEGSATYLLGYDQVGSLKAGAAMEGNRAACTTGALAGGGCESPGVGQEPHQTETPRGAGRFALAGQGRR